MAFALGPILSAVTKLFGASAASSIAGFGAQGLFSAAAAERERAWSEKMYNQYNSPAALVRQYQDAGINPALMFGQSTPAAAMTSSQAALPQNPVGDLVGVLGSLMNLSLVGEQKEGLELDNENKRIENDLQRLNKSLVETYGAARADAEVRQIEQTINKLLAETGEANTRSALNFAQADLVRAQKAGVSLDNVQKEWTKKFIESYHMTPELAGDLARSLSTVVSAGILSVTKLFDLFRKPKGSHTRSITEKQPDGTTITDVFSGFPDM